MKTICISELRKNLQLMLKKAAAGESLTVTSRGKKLAMIVPVKKNNNNSEKILKALRNTAIIDDILSPVQEDWDAEK